MYHKRKELIKFLITIAADPLKINKRNQSPMDLAKRYNLEEFSNTCLSERGKSKT